MFMIDFTSPFYYNYMQQVKNVSQAEILSSVSPCTSYAQLVVQPLVAFLPEIFSVNPKSSVKLFRLPYALVMICTSLLGFASI